MRTVSILLGLLWLFSHSAHAKLQWESRTQELHGTLLQRELIGRFKFRNVGPQPVKILTIATGCCACTKATSDKTLYQPGECGEITATFTVGRGEGKMTKPISVMTDCLEEKLVRLDLTVWIDPVLTVEPSLLTWNREESLDAKEFLLTTASAYPVHDVKVTSTNANILATLTKAAHPRQYRVTIRPQRTNGPLIGLVKVEADYPPEAPKAYYIAIKVL